MPAATAEKSLVEKLEALLAGIREKGIVCGSEILLDEAKSGDEIPDSHLAKISKWTRGTIPAENLYTFPVLMIDTAPTRNMVLYTAASQKKTAKSWIGTTYLFNSMGTSAGFFSFGADHTLQAASQVARIYDTRVVETPKGEIGTLGWVYTVRGAGLDDFITKVEAGILREVSIHVTVPEGVICSICNDTFDKCKDHSGGWHFPGEKYGKQICYMSTGTGKLGPIELSQVACPGSVNAHIMKDGEVEEYPVVSLKEALGGSSAILTEIKSMKEAEARERLLELAKKAGVSLADFVSVTENVPHEHIDLVEAANVPTWAEAKAKKNDDPPDDDPKEGKECSECGHSMHEGACPVSGCECKEGKESAPPTAADPPTPKSTALFEGDCPVCKRTAASAPLNESEAVQKLRTEFQESVQLVVDEAQKKIQAAEEKAQGADTIIAERDDLFSDLVEETVEMAISAGQKAESERDSYRHALKELPFKAVREVRNALRGSKKASAPEDRKKALEQSMTERLKNQNGSTVLEKTEKGVRSTDRRKPRFSVA